MKNQRNIWNEWDLLKKVKIYSDKKNTFHLSYNNYYRSSFITLFTIIDITISQDSNLYPSTSRICEESEKKISETNSLANKIWLSLPSSSPGTCLHVSFSRLKECMSNCFLKTLMHAWFTKFRNHRLVCFSWFGKDWSRHFFSPKVRQYPGNEFPEIAHLRFFLHDKLSFKYKYLCIYVTLLFCICSVTSR